MTKRTAPHARMGGTINRRPKPPAWRPLPGLVPTLQAMLNDCTNPARRTQLATAIEDLNAGRVAVLLDPPDRTPA